MCDAGLQPNAGRWIRQDAARFLKPGTDPADVFPALDRKFNPNQPRIPAGQFGGGRWTDGSEPGADGSAEALTSADPASSDITADASSPLAFQAQSSGSLESWLKQLDDLAWKDPRQIPSAGATDAEENLQEVQGRRQPPPNWFPSASTEQNLRLEMAIARSGAALKEVHRYEANWKPREQSLSAPGSVEGAIANAEQRAREIETYLEQLRTGPGANFGPSLDAPRTPERPELGPCDGTSWINSYRTINNAPDLFGNPRWPAGKGTVSVSRIDGEVYFGVSSRSPGYSDADWNIAARIGERLRSIYPDMAKSNSGMKPNDSVFHAEANLLLRANQYSDGLEGRAIEVQVDNPICGQCYTVLPRLSIQLRNPYVTFYETTTGQRSVLWNGRWLRWKEQ
ncbi:hypothetical protein [Rhodopseudomonas sp. B29]|uniref:hypothetical protein n=1 Tax=Rhodopseudomonas sp. B29 TaxID=95607 RepID=UPI0011D18FC6|nr:hypothetical protein [Rhodopseudomonas sp. B29]